MAAMGETSLKKHRVEAFDLAKGISIVFMVAVHVLKQLSTPQLQESLPGNGLKSLVTLLGAPVFMFIMGILLASSEEVQFSKTLKRGLIIFLIGYLLNFLRGTLPTMLGLFAGELTEDIFSYSKSLTLMLEVDILSFAGLGLILLAIIGRIFPWRAAWLLFAGCLMVFSPMMWGYRSDYAMLNVIYDLFWGNKTYVYFPVFPWLCFPLLGMVYGALHRTAENRKKFYQSAALGGAVIMLFAALSILMVDSSAYHAWFTGDYAHGTIPPLMLVLMNGFLLCWISVCDWLARAVPSNAVIQRLYFWSEHVLAVYCIQWVLIGWVVIAIPGLQFFGSILFFLGILFITDRAVVYFNKLKPGTA